MSEQVRLLHEAWKSRNEIYHQLFGEYSSTNPKNYAPPNIPANRYDEGGAADPGDEDQRLSVLEYAPDPLRPYWMYVTSGLSNPWYQEEPAEVSGFGCEIMIKCPAQAEWPAQILRTKGDIGYLMAEVNTEVRQSTPASCLQLLRM